MNEVEPGRGRVLRLFAYGSLKTGECNFEQVQAYFVTAFPATAPGRLLLRHDGYPTLTLDPKLIVKMGTESLEEDLALAGTPAPPASSQVNGQLLFLNGGPEVLERLDIFEGYFPGRPSEYWRVLAPVWTAEHGWQTAWVYVASHPDPAWPPIDVWPPAGVRPEPYRHEFG